HLDIEILGFGGAGRQVPAVGQAGAQRIHLVLRQRRGVAAAGAEARRGVERLARIGAALPPALVEPGPLLPGVLSIERLWLRRRLLRHRNLRLFLLGLVLLAVVLLQRLGRRVGLGVGLLLGLLRLRFRLGLDLGRWLGLRRLGRRIGHLRRGRDDLRLLGHLGGGIVYRLGLRGPLPPWVCP